MNVNRENVRSTCCVVVPAVVTSSLERTYLSHARTDIRYFTVTHIQLTSYHSSHPSSCDEPSCKRAKLILLIVCFADCLFAKLLHKLSEASDRPPNDENMALEIILESSVTIDNFHHIIHNENFDEGRIKFLTRRLKGRSAVQCIAYMIRQNSTDCSKYI